MLKGRDLHVAFTTFYVYNFNRKCCGQKEKMYGILRIEIFATLDKKNPNKVNVEECQCHDLI